jgi:uncharacterized protein YjbI with pentapeptide repeats
MWKFAAAELGKDAALDAGIPKAKSEFLVSGSAYAPGGNPQSGCAVRARLGTHEKLLHVFGDRYWNGPYQTDPVRFTTMPLDWAHTFGGEGYDKNPLGKGFKPIKHGKVEIKWLPNIQYPTKLDTYHEQHEPAGFGPIDFIWPQRFSKAGTHDDRWLKEDFPGFARDIDWTIFNLSQPDQWFDKPLRGDEPYLLENMHPTKPLIEGRLPGFISRCFINRVTEGKEMFEEIQTHLSTVWFFPQAERAVLIYQGSCSILEEDGADLLQVVVGAEQSEEPKPVEHYKEVFAQRMDKKFGYLYALRDKDLLPSGLAVESPEQEEEKTLYDSGEDLLRKNMRRRQIREIEKARAVAASYGLDPDLHGPKMPPPEEPLPGLEQLPDYMDKLLAGAEAQKKTAEEGAEKSLKDVAQVLSALGMDPNEIRREISERPKGPPTFSAQAQIDSLKNLSQKLRNQGIVIDEIDGYVNDAAFCSRLFEGERKLKELYRFSAHLQDPALEIASEKAQLLRREIQDAYSKGQKFREVDLTGADLSGMDLHGADFEKAFLESANFSEANLTGCNFKNAVLAHAILKSADVTAANLEEANIGWSQLAGADFSGSNLTKAILAKADLTGTNFKGALLQGADCSGAIFKDADFSEVHAEQLNLLECSLEGIKLTGAKMGKCTFLKTDVTGVDFNNTNLQSSTFLEVKGIGAKFQGANLSGVCFVQQCNFESADFTGACLVRANLRGSILRGCDFTQAQLDSADLSECDLRNAKFYRATAHEARFIKANLGDAVMSSINAINAVFQRSDIRGADLRGANLFQCDIARVHADTRTQFDDAFMKKVRIYPLRVK